MTTKYLGSGDQIDHLVAGTAAVSGEFRIAGNVVASFAESAAIGETVAMFTRGRFKCVAETGVAWVAGDKLYLTAGSQVMTKTAGGNALAGHAAAVKASAAAIGEINLHPAL